MTQHCSIQEYFTVHGGNIIVNYRLTQARLNLMNTHTVHTVYGNAVVMYDDTSIKQYIWNFKLFKLLSDDVFVIGIDSSKKKHIQTNFADSTINTNDFYAFGSKGKIFTSTNQSNMDIFAHPDYDIWKSNDEIRIELDCTYNTLSLFINDNCRGLILNIKAATTYNLAIAMTPKYGIIELMTFTTTNYQM